MCQKPKTVDRLSDTLQFTSYNLFSKVMTAIYMQRIYHSIHRHVNSLVAHVRSSTVAKLVITKMHSTRSGSNYRGVLYTLQYFVRCTVHCTQLYSPRESLPKRESLCRRPWTFIVADGPAFSVLHFVESTIYSTILGCILIWKQLELSINLMTILYR